MRLTIEGLIQMLKKAQKEREIELTREDDCLIISFPDQKKVAVVPPPTLGEALDEAMEKDEEIKKYNLLWFMYTR